MVNVNLHLSPVSLVVSKVLLRTFTVRARACFRVVSFSLYSCFSKDTAALLLFPMQVAFQPE